MLRTALPDPSMARRLLGRMARGIRLAREAEERPADRDATQVVLT
jgi:CRP-like cAMP-binding protein